MHTGARALLALGICTLTATGCSLKGNMNTAAPKDMEHTPLIARSILYGNPDRASPKLSPDGAQLAFLAEDSGVMNVWVAPADQPDAARVVTQDRKRGIRSFSWAYTSDHILYPQDKDGDENWHIYATDVKTGRTKDLTPLDGIQARIQEVSHKFPGQILLAINDRTRELHDIYRVDLVTGRRELIQKNDGYRDFTTDDDYRVRLATRMTPDGGSEIFKPADGGDWTLFTRIPPEDSLTTSAIGFDKSGGTLYMIDSRNRDTAGIFTWKMETNAQKLLSANPRADVGGLLMHPTENTIQAVAFNYDRKQWDILDDAVRADMSYLKTVASGDVEVTSRTLDDKHWIVAYLMDSGPVRYYHYDRTARNAKFLFTNRRQLEGLPLTKMHPVTIKSRDGLNLVSYLSLPVWSDRNGRPKEPLPLVLVVHGGPWARDSWGFDPTHQWLTNRGYAALSVNFRGSTGLGKKHLNAGNFEWAGRMHDDLIDAVTWAIDQKIADPGKVAIFGGSYGGYATLVGLTFTPDVFCCGVDIVGPSNLITLLESIPPYWKPMMDMFTSRVGDPRTEEGRKLLEERSPLNHVAKIKRPLLIAQGANDPRVKQAESDQIVSAMKSKGIPVTYVLFPDEGHGFARPENRMAFYAVAEEFLARHLNGRFEPIGSAFTGAVITAPAGADQLPGLEAALKKG